MTIGLFRAALILGLLSCVGPFAIDMYLPAMPAIAADLGASISATQNTITAYFIAFGLGQLIYGPWADQAGRKPPLYAGMALFALGTLLQVLPAMFNQIAPDELLNVGWVITVLFAVGCAGTM